MDQLFESMQPRAEKRGVEKMVDDIERDVQSLLSAAREKPVALAAESATPEGIVEDEVDSSIDRIQNTDPTTEFPKAENTLSAEAAGNSSEFEFPKAYYVEKIALMAKLKALEAQLRKIPNVKNHRLVKVNGERATQRKNIRAEMVAISNRLQDLDIAHRSSEKSETSFVPSTL